MGFGLSNPQVSRQADIQCAIDERENLTVGGNLDRQIRVAEEHLARLHRIKREMEGSGLLSLRICDLQTAMNW